MNVFRSVKTCGRLAAQRLAEQFQTTGYSQQQQEQDGNSNDLADINNAQFHKNATLKSNEAAPKQEKKRDEKNDNSKQKHALGCFWTLGNNSAVLIALSETLATGHETVRFLHDKSHIFDKNEEVKEEKKKKGRMDLLKSVHRSLCVYGQLTTMVRSHQPSIFTASHRHCNDFPKVFVVSSDCKITADNYSSSGHCCAERSINKRQTICCKERGLYRAIDGMESALHNGIGVELVKRRLFSEASSYFHRASSHSAAATYNLGLCHAFGQGVRRDLSRAVSLWEEAANEGHAAATYQLAVCRMRGRGGLTRDPKLAVSMISSAPLHACLPEAQFYMGILMLKKGDDANGVHMIELAARKRHKQAMKTLKEWSDGRLGHVPRRVQQRASRALYNTNLLEKQPASFATFKMKEQFVSNNSNSGSICFEEPIKSCPKTGQNIQKSKTIADFRPVSGFCQSQSPALLCSEV